MGVVFSDFGLFLQFKEVTALRRSAPGASFSCQIVQGNTSADLLFTLEKNTDLGFPIWGSAAHFLTGL